MPLCFCGLKIDRAKPCVQCIVCDRLAHAACYKVEPSDIDLIKSSFKCKECLSARRASMSSSPVILTDRVNVVGVPAGNCLKGEDSKSTSVSIAPKRIADDNGLFADNSARNADKLNNSTAVLLNVNNKNTVQSSSNLNAVNGHSNRAEVINLSSAVQSSSNVNATVDGFSNLDSSMFTLFNELSLIKNENQKFYASLKAENEKLQSLVIDLRHDNSKLIDKVNSLELSINVLKSDYNLLKSKKIKKSNEHVCATNSTAEVNINAKKSLSTVPKSPPKENTSASNSVSTADSLIVNNMTQSYVNALSESSKPISKVVHNSLLSSCVEDGISLSSVDAQGRSYIPMVNSLEKRKRNDKTVVGSSDSVELNVVSKFKWIHLSSFKSSVESDEIISYVSKHFKIKSNYLACYKLVKKDANIKDLKFVNFKLGVTAGFYDAVFDSSLWPANVKLRPFHFLEISKEPIQLPQAAN